MNSSEVRENLIQRVNVGDSLTRTAARHPTAVALVEGDRRLTYAEFNKLVNKIAGGLIELGYKRGDALALASGNSVEFLVTYYACAKLGVVCVPINLGWRPDEAAYVLDHSEARGIVIETQLVSVLGPAIEKVQAVADVIVAPGSGGPLETKFAGRKWLDFAEVAALGSEIEPEVFVADRDPITYLYTSGTTAVPKGVVGNHTSIYLESMAMALEAGFVRDDRFVAMLPMFHTAQINCFCTPAVMIGATIHILRAFDPGVLLELIEKAKITQIFGLPMMYRAMLDHPDIEGRDLSSLRRACYAMAPMPDAQLKRCLNVFGCGFFLLFGQTEMSPTATLHRPENQLTHPGSVGTAVVNVQVGIMDPDGNLLPQGESGEIVYRGPHTLTGYLKNQEATDTAFEHGWFHSGDVGSFDADGVLWFSDRRKDVIKSGGENVASIEVEKALYAADSRLAEVVVVGLPHERWSEAITAIAVLRPGEDLPAAELLTSVRERLDPYKVPKSVIYVDELPRTSTGKIQKNVLRDQFARHYSDD